MTEKCVVCGLRWHVCRDKKIPPGGYVCPRCEYRGWHEKAKKARSRKAMFLDKENSIPEKVENAIIRK